jgi:hypothetical protein
MERVKPTLTELTAQKLSLEQRIKGYKASLSALAGPCSRSSLSKQIEECEMKLEQVRSLLGEI